MEKRKIVRSGLFSYTVSLPKEWISRYKLEKGSTVYIDEYGDGLILKPGKADKNILPQNSQCVFNIDKFPVSSVVRDITAAYLYNTKTIILEGNTLKDNIKLYKEALASYPGLEVIEETGNTLVLKNFINVDEFVVADLLRRSDIIIRSMFLDISESLVSTDKKLAEAVIQRDKEINRLTFIISMCLNHINNYPQDAKMHGMAVSLSPQIWELNGSFEKIGDELKRFARLSINANLSKKIRSNLILTFKQVEEFYLNVIASFYKGDIDKADKASSKRKDLFTKCSERLLHSQYSSERGMMSRMIYLISFVNAISRLVRYISVDKHSIVIGNMALTKKI